MLDEAAISLVVEKDALLGVLALVWFIGFVVALLFHWRSKGELPRGEYFALFAVSYLILSAFNLPLLFARQAFSAGILWVLIGGWFVIIGASGFFYGRISLARSRNAFGDSRYSILSVIPLANLFLLFKRSKDVNSAYIRTVSIVSGWRGVVAGLVLIVVSWGLSAWLEEQSNAIGLFAIQEDPTDADIHFLVHLQGLEATMEEIANDADLPIVVDELTRISQIDVYGTVLRRIYVVNSGTLFFKHQHQRGFDTRHLRQQFFWGLCFVMALPSKKCTCAKQMILRLVGWQLRNRRARIEKYLDVLSRGANPFGITILMPAD